MLTFTPLGIPIDPLAIRVRTVGIGLSLNPAGRPPTGPENRPRDDVVSHPWEPDAHPKRPRPSRTKDPLCKVDAMKQTK